MFLAVGICAALVHAKRSGEGQVVDAAMVDGAALLMTMFHAFTAMGIWKAERGVNLIDTGAHFYEVYETADHKFIAIGSIEPLFYSELLQHLGLTDDHEFTLKWNATVGLCLRNDSLHCFSPKPSPSGANSWNIPTHASRLFSPSARRPCTRIIKSARLSRKSMGSYSLRQLHASVKPRASSNVPRHTSDNIRRTFLSHSASTQRKSSAFTSLAQLCRSNCGRRDDRRKPELLPPHFPSGDASWPRRADIGRLSAALCQIRKPDINRSCIGHSS